VCPCAYLCGMRTTIDLPEPLFRSLKLLTVQKGVSLKTFITQALEAALQAPTAAGTRMEQPPITRGKGVIPLLTKESLAELLETEDESKSGR
jgi:hypothetical protein